MDGQPRRSSRQHQRKKVLTIEAPNPTVPKRRKPAKLVPPPNPPPVKRKHLTKKRREWVTEIKMKVASSPPGVYGTCSFQSAEFFVILYEFLRKKLPDVTKDNVLHWIELHPWITEDMDSQAPPNDDIKGFSKVPTPPASSYRAATEEEMLVESPGLAPNLSEISDDLLDWKFECTSEGGDDEGPSLLLIEANNPMQKPIGALENNPEQVGDLNEAHLPSIHGRENDGENTQKCPVDQPRNQLHQIHDEEDSMDSSSDFDINEISGIRAPTPPPAQYVSAWLQGSSFGQNLEEFEDLEAIYYLTLQAHYRSTNIPSVNGSVLALFQKTIRAMERLVLPVSYSDLVNRLPPQPKVE